MSSPLNGGLPGPRPRPRLLIPLLTVTEPKGLPRFPPFFFAGFLLPVKTGSEIPATLKPTNNSMIEGG